MKIAILQIIWLSRNSAMRAWWYLRSTAFQAWWFLRNSILRTWWFLRNTAFHSWWIFRNIVRSIALLKSPRMLFIFMAMYFSRYQTLFICHLSKITVKKYELGLLPVQHYEDDENIYKYTFHQSEVITISGPRFVGNYPIELHTMRQVYFNEPPIEIFEFKRIGVLGGTNLLLNDTHAIHPDLLDPVRDVIPLETFGIAYIDTRNKTISLQLPSKKREVKRAISLLGQCTGNYAHWLTETLPKLIIIDEISELKDFPLLVDNWIHPNLHACLSLFGGYEREFIGVSRWEYVEVDHLIDISPPAYVPPEFRSYHQYQIAPDPDPSFFPFSGFALRKLRDAAWRAVPNTAKKQAYKRLYLSRPPRSCGNPRFITNIDDVDSLITKYGFTTIDPGSLTIPEQVDLFRQAECIISPIGAALANAIFTPPGCQILVMSPYYEKANYYYFSNLMGVLGHHLQYVLGPQATVYDDNHLFHKNYSVNIDALQEALERLP